MTGCVVCRGGQVSEFLDLGRTALANRFVTDEQRSQAEPSHPLRLGHCPACGHWQLTEHVAPAEMFDEYLYTSSVSTTLQKHLHELAGSLTARYALDDGDLVIDIGANDGSLLEGFALASKNRRWVGEAGAPVLVREDGLTTGVRILGIDPAVNLRLLAEQKGVPIWNAFFSAQTAATILARHGAARMVTATNTFPHIPDLDDFMRGIDLILRHDGVFLIEAHYLMDMIDQNAFDTIYHEHVSYWSLTTMARLFSRFGFQVVRAERIPLHHGQLRVFVQRVGESQPDETVGELLDLESERQLTSRSACDDFATETVGLKRELATRLTDIRRQGGTVVGYGAPAKGNTLLSYLELGRETLPYIADRSTLKQGRYTPGAHIPVVPPQRILEDQPDYVLILAWNFADEIISQLTDYRRAGGKFILPVPRVTVI